ncbi:MlaD family protein [Nocardioides sp.]|uniref:MlaD family protein n=1 Tax=Nocardioides sp. TaxID=35761 RepID=UPI0039E2CFA7
MKGAGVRAKLIGFVIVALAGTSYLGAKYAGLDLFSRSYDVTFAMTDASGLFEGSEVTYHGVPVGKVDHLTATTSGVEAVARIDGDAPPIPADVTATVTDRSVIGEQYLNLSGGTSGELGGGDRVTVTGLTPDLTELLRSGRDFTASVPQDALNTVIDESYDLAQGSAGNLRRLVSTSIDFQQAADRNFLTSASLIRNASTVLKTQENAASSIRSYSRDLGVLADTLRDSDADLRELIDNSPAAARQLSALFDSVGRPLGTLMSNLVTTAQVFGTNAAGVEDTLIRVPEAVSVGWAITGSRGINLGLVPTFFDPLPCTDGYGGTTLRKGTDTSAGAPLNTDAGCTASTSSGVDVLGPQALADGAPAAARVDVARSLGDLLGGVE